KLCKKGFSSATMHVCYRQNKRHFNFRIFKLLASCMSQRRMAIYLGINRKTVVRKFLFVGSIAEVRLRRDTRTQPLAEVIEFDDMETFEHTKKKPLSITMAV